MANNKQTYQEINLTTFVNVTTEERRFYLEELQHQTTLNMIPALVFLICLALIGLVGNVLVLIVYFGKFPKTSIRIFIMTMAGFDLVTNVIVIPGEIFIKFHSWDFNYPSVCHSVMFLVAFTTISAAVLLFAIAVVRYLKVCKPFGKLVTIKQAKIASLCIVVFSLLSSIAHGVIRGRHTIQTPRSDIFGHNCDFEDTIWPKVNNAYFVLLFVSGSIGLVVLYCLIGAQAWRHRERHGVTEHSTAQVVQSGNSQSSTSYTLSQSKDKTCMSDSPKNIETNLSEDLPISGAADDSSGNVIEANILSHESISKPDRQYLRITSFFGEAIVINERTNSNDDNFKGNDISTVGDISFDVETSDDQTLPDINTSHNTVSISNNQNIPVQSNKIDNINILKVISESRDAQNETKKDHNSKKGLVPKWKTMSSLDKRSSPQKRGIGRTNIMLIMISAVFIIGYLPHLALMFFKTISPDQYAAMDNVGLSFYNLFVRLYYLNSAANPVIYSLCDVNFRTQCLLVFKNKIFTRKH